MCISLNRYYIQKKPLCKTVVVIFIFLFFSCKNNQNRLSNTKWLTVKFTVDSNNYLTVREKGVPAEFDTSIKLYSDFSDTSVFTYVEGKEIDTSSYKVRNDTLFFIHNGSYRDTNIILKLTSDSLITRRLAGSTGYAIRQK